MFELIEAKVAQSKNKADKNKTARFSFDSKLLKFITRTPTEIKPKINTAVALKMFIGSYE